MMKRSLHRFLDTPIKIFNLLHLAMGVEQQQVEKLS